MFNLMSNFSGSHHTWAGDFVFSNPLEFEGIEIEVVKSFPYSENQFFRMPESESE